MSAMRSKNPGLDWLRACTRQWRAPVLAVLLGMAVTGGRFGYAGDPRAPRWHASSASLNDCQVAVEARRSMMADPVLGEFNIGITVTDSAATVWGAVPDAEIAARVRSRLSAVTGISTVVDDLRIDPDSRLRPLRNTVASEVDAPAERYKTGLASGYLRSGPASFTGTVPSMVLNPGPPCDPARMPFVTLLKPTPTDTDLAGQLETLRRSVPRFRDVGIRSVGSMVYLRPYHGSSAIVLEFAGRISQLPGVSRVIIEDTRGPKSLAIP
jgi:hypothetical protein